MLREARCDDGVLRGTSISGGLSAYRELIRAKHYLDYSSIMQEAVEAIATDAGLRARLGERIKHVIVDEYQDVNPIQERLVRLLGEQGADICVVGDDDQTIYQWRGSDVGNILNFRDRYGGGVKEVRLQENFRSSRGVIETARDFIRQNADRLTKAMVPTDAQPYEPGDLVRSQPEDAGGGSEVYRRNDLLTGRRGVQGSRWDRARSVVFRLRHPASQRPNQRGADHGRAGRRAHPEHRRRDEQSDGQQGS